MFIQRRSSSSVMEVQQRKVDQKDSSSSSKYTETSRTLSYHLSFLALAMGRRRCVSLEPPCWPVADADDGADVGASDEPGGAAAHVCL
jgi:hypothetical protein